MPVPPQLPQIPILPTRYPDLGKITREQEVQNMQCIFTIRLRLAPSLGSDHLCIPHPQLNFRFFQQSLEPARVPTGLHPHTHSLTRTRQSTVELLRSLAVREPLLLFPYQQKQFVGSSDDNHTLQ